MIVEAWAAVQRGYVDGQFGGRDWKGLKADYLKRKYKDMGEARAGVSAMLQEGLQYPCAGLCRSPIKEEVCAP